MTFDRSQHMRELWADPAFREMMSRKSKESWADPAYRERLAQLTKERWKDPAYKKKMSQIMRETWTPERREKRSGINHHNWQGGISFEPYPPGFNAELKRSIRARDGDACVLCGSEERLGVHHINHVKEDLDPENLVTLCRSCHGRVHGGRLEL